MAFIGGGDSTTTTNTTLDNSVDDHSVNTNNAGAIQVGGNMTMTDQGTVKAAVDLGSGAFGLSEKLVSSALKSNQNAMDLSLQTATGAIDHGLAVASEASRSDGQAIMQTVTKVGIAIAVVMGLGFLVKGKK